MTKTRPKGSYRFC